MLRRFIAAAGVGGAMFMAVGSPAVWASSGDLSWNAPKVITTGVPVLVSSIDNCPPVPTPGDSILVQITVLFNRGGGMGQVLQANSDGSWSGTVTFNFSNAPKTASIFANCLDYNGTTGTSYATYQSHRVKLVG